MRLCVRNYQLIDFSDIFTMHGRRRIRAQHMHPPPPPPLALVHVGNGWLYASYDTNDLIREKRNGTGVHFFSFTAQLKPFNVYHKFSLISRMTIFYFGHLSCLIALYINIDGCWCRSLSSRNNRDRGIHSDSQILMQSIRTNGCGSDGCQQHWWSICARFFVLIFVAINGELNFARRVWIPF